mgnify:FL=1
MKNKSYGIVLSDSRERYYDIDTSYYENYKSKEEYVNTKIAYSDLDLVKNKEELYEFGDKLFFDGINLDIIYLFNSGRFSYVYFYDENSNINRIERVTTDSIVNNVGKISDFDKERLIKVLRKMINENKGIPVKAKKALVKLINR